MTDSRELTREELDSIDKAIADLGHGTGWLSREILVNYRAVNALLAMARAYLDQQQAIQQYREWLTQRRDEKCVSCAARYPILPSGIHVSMDKSALYDCAALEIVMSLAELDRRVPQEQG